MSKIFYVAYDLNDADSEDYSEIKDILTNNFKGVRVQKSLWCLKIDDIYECSDIKEELLDYFEKKDKVIVIEANDYDYRGCIKIPYSFD